MRYILYLVAPLFSLVCHTHSAEFTVECPDSITSGCTCYEDDTNNNLLRIKCSGTSMGNVKSALVGDDIVGRVWKLELYTTGDSAIPTNYLKEFTAITELEVRYSDSLTTIEPGGFVGGSLLEVIHLGSNNINWLSGDMFEGVSTNLQELILSSNDIVYLYSDLEDVFLKTSESISLLGNSLKCTCQIEWLVNLLNSDKDLPDFFGATCKDTDDEVLSLASADIPFSDCPDVCSEGFHNCGENETCATDSSTQSFSCSDAAAIAITSSANNVVSSSFFYPSPSPSIAVSSSLFNPSPSPSIAVSSSFFNPSPSPSIAMTSSAVPLSNLMMVSSPAISVLNIENETSSELFPAFTYGSISVTTLRYVSSAEVVQATTISSPILSSLSSETMSMNNTMIAHSSTAVPPSPSPITSVPEDCGTEFCLATQFCSSACGCPYCTCTDGWSWSGSSNEGSCIVASFSQDICRDDGLIGLTWPSVTAGSAITIPCCSSGEECIAMATRTCSADGEWSDFSGSNCVSASIYSLQDLYDIAKEGDSDALQTLGSTLLEESSSQLLLPEDLVFLSEQIIQAIDLIDDDVTDPQFISDIISSVSNLLDDNLVVIWQEQETPSSVIAQLFSAVETLAINYPLQNGTVTLKTDNLALQVIIPEGDEFGWNISSTLLNSTSLEGQSSIYLPGSLLMDALGGQNLSDCDVRVVASLWDVHPSLLQVNNSATVDSSAEPLVHGMCDWSDGSTSYSSATLTVNSIVISASLYSSNCTLNTSNLSKPVQITLHHVNQSLDDPTCSFLDPEDKSGSEWIGGGCRVQETGSSDSQTVCECFHLTSFALLMSPTGSTPASKSLNIATKVGLSVSIVALVITCILLFSLKLESQLNIVHRQLALALCLSQIVFLVGVDRVSIPYPDAACTAIAALLHYLLLCTFAWELIEGIHLYLFIVKVFYNKKIIWSYYPLAWGIPVIIVGITLGPSFCDYGSKNFCWITTGQGTNWAFHGPVLLVIAVNIVVLVIITGVVIRSAKRKDPDSCGFCKLLQASFILVPTLGLTWILGFFIVSDGVYATVVEWIFFVCTTLQGIFIFTIHCILNTEVRASFLKSLGFRETARKQKSVFSLKPIGTLNSLAASGFRRLSQGGGSRRGSLEPLESSGLPNPQDLKELQARLAIKLATVNEEDDVSEEAETQVNDKSLGEDGFSAVSGSYDRLIPLDEEDIDGSQVNLLDDIVQRSSTDGLLEEEKHGIYLLETGENGSSLSDGSTGVNNRTDLINDHLQRNVEENEVILEMMSEREKQIELVGFSLGVTTDNLPSVIPLLEDDGEQLKSKSLSHIGSERAHDKDGQLARWHSESSSRMLNSAKDTLKPQTLQETSDHSSVQSSLYALSIINDESDAFQQSMEELLIERAKSSEDVLENELFGMHSHEDLLY